MWPLLSHEGSMLWNSVTVVTRCNSQAPSALPVSPHRGLFDTFLVLFLMVHWQPWWNKRASRICKYIEEKTSDYDSPLVVQCSKAVRLSSYYLQTKREWGSITCERSKIYSVWSGKNWFEANFFSKSPFPLQFGTSVATPPAVFRWTIGYKQQFHVVKSCSSTITFSGTKNNFWTKPN